MYPLIAYSHCLTEETLQTALSSIKNKNNFSPIRKINKNEKGTIFRKEKRVNEKG